MHQAIVCALVATPLTAMACITTQAPTQQPIYVGSFKAIAVREHSTVTLDLPVSYSCIHNVCDACPWLSDDTTAIDTSNPALKSQSSYNPVVQVLDRK